MQNNVTYLSRKLQRSLDNNYNVIDMPAVIEIISTLEKTSVTKELLETTRLGKYINELRRKTSNESLAKRAKELLKRWRDLILPDANGQIRASSAASVVEDTSSKKRPASSSTPPTTKKLILNGAATNPSNPLNHRGAEYDFSDNSNCSIKELKKTDVIFINSDSNSSMPESISHGDHFEVSNDATTTDNTDTTTPAIPKKRGRKKGSKNHKNLVIAAEESFTNKMAVSRNSKVKTTQELLADIQNRKPSSQDIELRTAQLTESLSRIEHKLNPQKTISINTKTSSSVKSVKSEPSDDEDEIIVDVVGDPPPPIIKGPLTIENLLSQLPQIDKSCLDDRDEIPLCECPTPKVHEIRVPLQPEEQITVQIVGTTNTNTNKESLFAPPSPEILTPPPPNIKSSNSDDERTSVCADNDNKSEESYEENILCPAKLFLSDKYQLLESVDASNVSGLHEKFIPNVNGNFGAPTPTPTPTNTNDNIVPTYMSERLTKQPNENFQKYSISISDRNRDHDRNHDQELNKTACDSDSEVFRTNTIINEDDTTEVVGGDVAVAPSSSSRDCDFREWHETLDVISYNDELLRILPYVIID